MKPWIRWTVVLLLVALAGAGGWWVGRRGAGSGESKAAGDEDEASAAEVKPVARVRVAPATLGSLRQTITAYGTMTTQSFDVRVLSVPYESVVTRLLSAPGQSVRQGAPLIEVEPSPAARLALSEATLTLENAKQSRQLVQQRFDQKLATISELQTAEADLRTAEGRLNNLRQGGVKPTGATTLSAAADGQVSKIDVQLGQVVPAAGPLLELTAQQRVEARLGLEPDDAAFMTVGQEVTLHSTEQTDDKPTVGKIRLISSRISPDTRLVDVFVEVGADSRLLLDSFVTATMVKQRADGLIVPKAAVLPAEEGQVLFTVAGGKAVRHVVTEGVSAESQVQVIDAKLHAGDPVVIEGNAELQDGMDVTVAAESPAAASTSQPAEKGS